MNSVTTPKGIANLVRGIATYEDRNADFSEVIEAIEAINNARAQDALRGAVRLAAPDAGKLRRFAVAYLYEDAIHVAYGVEYPVRKQRKGEGNEATKTPTKFVHVGDDDAPFYDRHESIESFSDYMKRRNLPYHIEFVD